MRTKLVKNGDKLTIELDPALVRAVNLDADAPVDVTLADGSVLISPVREPEREARLNEAMEKAHQRYGPMFKRLADR